jgi:hypothetical protein
MDSTSTESIFEIRWAKRKKEFINSNEISDDIHELPEILFNKIGPFNLIKENVLYISRFIVKSIYMKIDCSSCFDSLIYNPPTHNYCHEF